MNAQYWAMMQASAQAQQQNMLRLQVAGQNSMMSQQQYYEAQMRMQQAYSYSSGYGGYGMSGGMGMPGAF